MTSREELKNYYANMENSLIIYFWLIAIYGMVNTKFTTDITVFYSTGENLITLFGFIVAVILMKLAFYVERYYGTIELQDMRPKDIASLLVDIFFINIVIFIMFVAIVLYSIYRLNVHGSSDSLERGIILYTSISIVYGINSLYIAKNIRRYNRS